MFHVLESMSLEGQRAALHGTINRITQQFISAANSAIIRNRMENPPEGSGVDGFNEALAKMAEEEQSLFAHSEMGLTDRPDPNVVAEKLAGMRKLLELQLSSIGITDRRHVPMLITRAIELRASSQAQPISETAVKVLNEQFGIPVEAVRAAAQMQQARNNASLLQNADKIIGMYNDAQIVAEDQLDDVYDSLPAENQYTMVFNKDEQRGTVSGMLGGLMREYMRSILSLTRGDFTQAGTAKLLSEDMKLVLEAFEKVITDPSTERQLQAYEERIGRSLPDVSAIHKMVTNPISSATKQ